mgnify:CR=1 FL=1
MPNVFSISALNAYIRRLIERDAPLQDIWVEGEVSNLRAQSSGHLYFTLKDASAELRTVIWRDRARALRHTPQNGEQILAHGKIGVYEQGGIYQLYADAVQLADAQGDLAAQFHALWDKLAAEGLFNPDLKRPLPFFPQRIGVVTSESTAAFQDVCNVLRRRYPLAEVWLSHTPVQGADAPPQIMAALRRADAFGVDVILLVRGGGSAEDLWCFNDEQLARALRTTRAPVVTGIGHEIDTTLVDGSADRRAPTPSAAAELATPDVAALDAELRRLAGRAEAALGELLQARQTALADSAHKLRLVSPRSRIQGEAQRLDALSARLERTAAARLQKAGEMLSGQARALESANPLNLLARGYAILSHPQTGARLTSAAEAMPNADLHVQLTDGRLTVRVQERTLHPDSIESDSA